MHTAVVSLLWLRGMQMMQASNQGRLRATTAACPHNVIIEAKVPRVLFLLPPSKRQTNLLLTRNHSLRQDPCHTHLMTLYQRHRLRRTPAAMLAIPELEPIQEPELILALEPVEQGHVQEYILEQTRTQTRPPVEHPHL